MTIASILSIKGREVVTATTDQPVIAVLRLLAERRIGAVPVLAGGKVEGVFSERDLVYRLAEEGPGLLERPVGTVMTAPAITVAPDTPILSALALMTRRRIRHLPVIEGEHMIGVVSIGDLVKLRIDRIEAEADAMRHYIAGT